MPSIKDKDLVSGEKRCVVKGLGCLCIFLATILFVVASDDGQQSSDDEFSSNVLFMLCSAGFMFIGLSCKKYVGKIVVIREVPNGCPDPNCNGTLEYYKLMINQTTERHYRVIYTRTETTTTWEGRVHCMSCEKDAPLIQQHPVNVTVQPGRTTTMPTVREIPVAQVVSASTSMPTTSAIEMLRVSSSTNSAASTLTFAGESAMSAPSTSAGNTPDNTSYGKTPFSHEGVVPTSETTHPLNEVEVEETLLRLTARASMKSMEITKNARKYKSVPIEIEEDGIEEQTSLERKSAEDQEISKFGIV